METKSLEDRLRKRAGEKLNKHLDGLFGSVLKGVSLDAYHCKTRFKEYDPKAPTPPGPDVAGHWSTYKSVANCVDEARRVSYAVMLPVWEDKEIAEFMAQVDQIQGQLDELRDSIPAE